MSKVLVVGAGFEQYPIIKRARENGHHVIAVDKNVEAYGFKYATESYCISTRNKEEVLKLAQRKNVDAVTYMITETPLESIQYVTSKLNLPGPSFSSVLITQNKYKMRSYFDKFNINNPKYRQVDLINDLLGVENQIEYPFIIKPIDKGGQIGLHKINNKRELELAVAELEEQGIKKDFIVEEFIEGEEVNVVATIMNGKVTRMIASDRIKHSYKSFGVVLRHLYPCSEFDKIESELEQLCNNIAKAMQINNGIIFPQVIKSKDGLIVVEVGERIPGGIMKEVFEYATGIDLLDFQLDISLGKVKKNITQYKSYDVFKAVTVKFLTSDPGNLIAGPLKGITGIEQALKVAGVRKVDFFQDPRINRVFPLRQGSDRFFYVVAVGEDREECIQRSDQAEQLINIETF